MMPQPPTFRLRLQLSSFLPFRLSVLSNTISRRIADLYDREFGLSVWQWRVMAVTADTPGISATEIGQRTEMDKVAVSRAVAGLIEMGYLVRRLSETDARRSDLFLTEAGEEVYALIVPLARAEESRLISSLSYEEQVELERIMRKLARAAAPERDLW
jgi:DNA-binding MarR family transcriptional regulator